MTKKTDPVEPVEPVEEEAPALEEEKEEAPAPAEPPAEPPAEEPPAWQTKITEVEKAASERIAAMEAKLSEALSRLSPPQQTTPPRRLLRKSQPKPRHL